MIVWVTEANRSLVLGIPQAFVFTFTVMHARRYAVRYISGKGVAIRAVWRIHIITIGCFGSRTMKITIYFDVVSTKVIIRRECAMGLTLMVS